MEMAMRDLSMLDTTSSKKKAMCFSDLIGTDTDGSFRDSLTYQQSSAVSEISIAGQTVQPGSSIQIALRDEGCLYDLRKTKISFQVTYPVSANRVSNNIPFNALYLLRPTSCQIGGSLVWSTALGEHYIQQRLLLRKPDEIAGKALGLALPLGPQSVGAEEYKRNARTVLTYPLIDFKQSQIQILSTGNGTNSVILNCSISLADLFPEVVDSFVDGKLWIGNGQHAIFNCMIIQTSQIRGAALQNLAGQDFNISKAQLLKVYTKLDGTLISNIQRGSISIYKRNVTGYPVALSASTVFNINLDKSQRLRYLYFAISPTKVQDVDNALAYAETNINYVQGSTVNFPVAPQSMYHGLLMKNCTLMSFNFGGHTFTLNQQQLQSIFESTQEEYLFSQDHPYMRLMFAAFRMDVSRFGIDDEYFGDAFGSSSGAQLSAQVTLNFEPGTIMLNLASTNETFNGGNYTCRLFTETISMAACENGLYKNIA